MCKTVIKRDGRRVVFDPAKVQNAVIKAMVSTQNGVDQELCSVIAYELYHNDCVEMNVEEIQDVVERKLMESSRKDVAKQYIAYRHERSLKRNEKMNEIYKSIVDAENNEVTRENANMNADTPAGMMMKFASEATKKFVDDYLLSPEAQEAVRNNYIHIHDKDYYPTRSFTCVQHPLDKILSKGFVAGHGESRPAKRIETASILGCISMETVQNEMHGGQSIPAFDFYMAPYVRKAFEEEVRKGAKFYNISEDDLNQMLSTEVEDYITRDTDNLVGCRGFIVQNAINETVERVHQAMEAFVHNMNTIHSRGGNQVVFSSLNYGTDTSAEGRCVIRELLTTTYKGIGGGATAIFPIQIWKKKRGVNYLSGDPNYDLYELACEVSARRFFPNFVNLDASYNLHEDWKADDPNRYQYEVCTMGCRTRTFENRFGPKTAIGRGNLSFTTINLPKIALECMHIKDEYTRRTEFITKLRTVMDVAAKQLHERFIFQSKALKKQFPLLMSGLWLGSENLGENDTVESVINQGTLAIGFIGLAEALIALVGKHHGESDEAQQLGLEIITFMRDLSIRYSDVYQHNYSIIATPAESVSGKFIKKDKIQFGSIPGVTDKEYYTNSNHIPVYYHCTAQHKAKIEGPYHNLTRGGHIFYVEIDGDATHNPEAIKTVVDLMDKYDIGYGSVNHNRNRCMDCGYENADRDIKCCPKCGSERIDKLCRITGYLVGSTERWNAAKLAELNDRVVHGNTSTKRCK